MNFYNTNEQIGLSAFFHMYSAIPLQGLSNRNILDQSGKYYFSSFFTWVSFRCLLAGDLNLGL